MNGDNCGCWFDSRYAFYVFDEMLFLLTNASGWFWLCGRYSITKAFCIAFVMTFFSAFDVPVFWPILLFYWLVLFVLTMRRQIIHMIKYKYVPFSIGKQVCSLPWRNPSFINSGFHVKASCFCELILGVLFFAAVWWKESFCIWNHKPPPSGLDPFRYIESNQRCFV